MVLAAQRILKTSKQEFIMLSDAIDASKGQEHIEACFKEVSDLAEFDGQITGTVSFKASDHEGCRCGRVYVTYRINRLPSVKRPRVTK